MKKIIVLDFKNQKVHVYPYDEENWEDSIDFLLSVNNQLDISNCQWMVVDTLNLTIY